MRCTIYSFSNFVVASSSSVIATDLICDHLLLFFIRAHIKCRTEVKSAANWNTSAAAERKTVVQFVQAFCGGEMIRIDNEEKESERTQIDVFEYFTWGLCCVASN